MTEHNEIIKKRIFEKNSLAGIKLENRIIRAATHEGMSDADGYPSADLTELYERLAKGGVGAIITGFAGVERRGKPLANMLMIDDDAHVESFKRMNQALKPYGVPLIMQIAHGGGKSDPSVTGEMTAAPSALRYPVPSGMARELTHAEIGEIIECFVYAILRAKKAGFAGVELHAAHGYLLSQFLSPAMNRRNDMWGGSTENRFRIIGEIIRRAREKARDYPILMKYSAYDGDKNGMRLDEAIVIAKLFENAGGGALEISRGGVNDGAYPLRFEKPPVKALFSINPVLKNMPWLKKKMIMLLMSLTYRSPEPLHDYNLDAAREIKKHVNIPVIVVGGIRNLDTIERIITEETADYVSLSRPLVIEPNLVRKFKEGKQKESRCIDCGYCLMGTGSDPLKCYNGKI